MALFNLCTFPSKHILNFSEFYIIIKLLRVNFKQDAVWAALGAFHCNKAISNFLEGITVADHFGFLAFF
jgi:hypothetical protein